MENAGDELAWQAQLQSYLGNYTWARKLCREAGGIGNDSSLALVRCAKALAEAGDVTQAEALAARLDRKRPEDTVNQGLDLPLIRSIIENKRENAAKALDLLAPIAQYEQGESQVLYYRGQAYFAAGDHSKAADEFQKVISNRGWTDWGVFTPLATLGLARVYAAQGDHDKSRNAYDDFFSIWKDADPTIPTLRQAKDEYTKLPATASAAPSASGNGR